jgi:hypothetical protein
MITITLCMLAFSDTLTECTFGMILISKFSSWVPFMLLLWEATLAWLLLTRELKGSSIGLA